MTLAIDPERLACGTQVDLLLAHLAGDTGAVPGDHAVGCPHCQRAVAELRPGLEALRDHTGRPGPIVPPRIEEAVLRRIRAGRRGPTVITLTAGPSGTTSLHVGVLAELARIAAEGVSGVLHATVDHTDGGGGLIVGLHVRYGLSMPSIAARCRSAIIDLLLHQTSWVPDRVDVRIDDLSL